VLHRLEDRLIRGSVSLPKDPQSTRYNRIRRLAGATQSRKMLRSVAGSRSLPLFLPRRQRSTGR